MTEVEKWMNDNFPCFCRRVCNLCNPQVDGIRKMLLQCPIVKFDSYTFLMQEDGNTHARVSKLLKKQITQTVTSELVEIISSKQPKVYHRKMKPRSEVSQPVFEAEQAVKNEGGL